MNNSNLIKIAGALAIISFLFLPVAGCGIMTVTGLDIFQTKEVDTVVKITVAVAMLCAVAIIIVKDRTQSFIGAIVGILLLVVAYFVAKSKLKSSSNDMMDLSSAIELKSGSYLSMLCFLAAAVISRVKNELFSNTSAANQSPPTPPSDPNQESAQ